jgi:FKBP-type peptidyl-prolyl cis-trans isomerase
MHRLIGCAVVATCLCLPAAGCIEVGELVYSIVNEGRDDSGAGGGGGDTLTSPAGGGDVPDSDTGAGPPPETANDDVPPPDEATADDDDTAAEDANEEGIPPLPEGGALVTNFSGLRVYDFEVGDGARPVRSDSVVVDYVGYLPDGTVFDSGEMVAFPLSGVIEGFAEGIEGMNEGGRRRLVIPPNLGYGTNGNPNAGIGGDDTITFDVTLHTVE